MPPRDPGHVRDTDLVRTFIGSGLDGLVRIGAIAASSIERREFLGIGYRAASLPTVAT